MNLDKLDFNKYVVGTPRINQIMGMQLDGGNLLPKPITYKDIDTEVTAFVDDKFNVSFGEQKLKTFFFAQQRMSEFTKTWEMLDENRNVIPNFKIVTRENNPKPGTIQGGMFNIPGEQYFDIGTFNKWDGNKNITVTCKVKQPYCVDIIYNIKFITNRLSLLNEMNNKVIDEFKARQSYVIVNGHFMPLVLEDVSDESDYELDQRKIFVQTYQLKVLGYIINEDDIIFQENIVRSLISTETDVNKPLVQLHNNSLVVNFPRKSKTNMTFKSSGDYNVVSVNADNSNVIEYTIKVNDIEVGGAFPLNKYDRVSVSIKRNYITEHSKIIMIIE
jgi:hypothetical protein